MRKPRPLGRDDTAVDVTDRRQWGSRQIGP